MNKLLYPEESYKIRGSCFAVYQQFRNTQKEAVYQRSLAKELQNKVYDSARPAA